MFIFLWIPKFIEREFQDQSNLLNIYDDQIVYFLYFLCMSPICFKCCGCMYPRISRLMRIGSRYFPRLYQERTLSSISQSQPLSLHLGQIQQMHLRLRICNKHQGELLYCQVEGQLCYSTIMWIFLPKFPWCKIRNLAQCANMKWLAFYHASVKSGDSLWLFWIWTFQAFVFFNIVVIFWPLTALSSVSWVGQSNRMYVSVHGFQCLIQSNYCFILFSNS